MKMIKWILVYLNINYNMGPLCKSNREHHTINRTHIKIAFDENSIVMSHLMANYEIFLIILVFDVSSTWELILKFVRINQFTTS